MALYQFLNHQNQVRESSCSDNTTSHGLSKSQLCLHKILHIIASYRPPQEMSKETCLNLEFEENRRINIDLNMGLSPSLPAEVDENQVPSESSSLSACSFVNNDLKNNDSSVEFIVNQYSSVHDSPTIRAIREESRDEDDQEITKVKEDKNKESIEVVPFQDQKNTNKDCLAILIEAAEVVSGHQLEDKESDRPEQITATTGSKSSCKCSWVVDLYEESTTDSVVRSKRGRSQILPCRYRDSSVLLGPWKRQSRPQKADSKKRKSR